MPLASDKIKYYSILPQYWLQQFLVGKTIVAFTKQIFLKLLVLWTWVKQYTFRKCHFVVIQPFIQVVECYTLTHQTYYKLISAQVFVPLFVHYLPNVPLFLSLLLTCFISYFIAFILHLTTSSAKDSFFKRRVILTIAAQHRPVL